MPIFSDQKGFAPGLAEALIAVDVDTSGVDEGLKKARQNVEQQTAAMGASFDTVSRRSRFALQNAAFQVQDFVVQVGSGTSALRAFAQQAPQFISAFAITPQTAVFSSLLAIVASLGGAFLASGKAAQSSAEQYKALSDELANLAKEYETTSGAARDFIAARSADVQTAQTQVAAKAVDETTAAFKRQIDTLVQLSQIKVGAGLGQFVAENAEAIKQISGLTLTTGSLVSAASNLVQASQLQRVFDDAVAGSEELRAELARLMAEFRDTGDINAFKKALADISDSPTVTPAQQVALHRLEELLAASGAAAAVARRDLDAFAQGLDPAQVEKYTAKLKEMQDQLRVAQAKAGLPILPLAAPSGGAPAAAAGAPQVEVKVKTAELEAAQREYQNLVDAFQLTPPKTTPVVATTQIDAAKVKVDTLAAELAKLQSGAGFAPPATAGPAAAAPPKPASQQVAVQSSKEATDAFLKEADAAKALGISLEQFQAPQTSEALRQRGRELAQFAQSLSQTQELVKFTEKTRALNDQIEVLARGGSFTAAGRQAATLADALRALNVTPAEFAKWPEANKQIVTGLVSTTERLHELGKAAEGLQAITKQFDDLRNKVIIANAPTSELRQLLQSLGSGVDLSKIVDQTGNFRKGMEEAGASALDMQRQLGQANVKIALEDQIDALRNKALAANAPTQQLRDLLTSIASVKGVNLADFIRTGKLPDEIEALNKQIAEMQQALGAGGLRQLSEDLDFQAGLQGVPERYQQINTALHQMGIDAEIFADHIRFGASVTDDTREALTRAKTAADGLRDARVAAGAEQSDQVKLLQLEASLGDEAAATRLKMLETEQKITELRRQGVPVSREEEAKLKAAAAQTPEERQTAARVEQGGALPDRIDAANVAAQELSQTLTDVDNLGFDSLKESFSNIAQQIAQMIIQALIFRAIMASVGGFGAPAGGDTTGAGGAGFSLPFFGGPRAQGGPVLAGQTFIGAERGFELFVGQSGRAQVLEKPGLFKATETGQVIANHHLRQLRRLAAGTVDFASGSDVASRVDGNGKMGGDTFNFDFRGASQGSVADGMNAVYAAARRDVLKDLTRSPGARRSIGLRGAR